ncbi:MAG: hypothetical protein BGO41_15735 [Clostridiales bacterium 38-18]|nr:MAG: hypothetical protein BGO41_15735 [Clostridiales bacterium 38-18]
MKKTLLAVVSIVIIVTMLLSIYLAIDVEKNLMIRRKIVSILDPTEMVHQTAKVLYGMGDDAIIDEHSDWILQKKNDENRTFINIENLKTEWISSHYDTDNFILSIVDGRHHIQIDQLGNVKVDFKLVDHRVEIIQLDDSYYLDLTALIKLPEGEALGFYEFSYHSGDSLVIMNRYLPYRVYTSSDEIKVFGTIEALTNYQEKHYSIDFLYKLNNLFNKAQIVDLIKNKPLYLFNLDEKSVLVVTNESVYGIVDNSIYSKSTIIEGKKREVSVINKEVPEKIVMTWEAVYSYNPDPTTIPDLPNLNVISPTWYELSDAEGNINGNPSEAYINWTKEKGLILWPLVSNAFDIDLTHTFLNNAISREHFIQALILEAKLKGYSGINIDFENVYLADRDALTHFIAELAIYMNQEGLVLSMDVTVMGGSDNWSKCYDHEKLGKIVDFLIIMTYDEFWASSPVSGPVASYDWMLRHMTELTEVVSKDKLVLGIPLYTRVWREYPREDVANQIRTKSSAIGMAAQNALIEKYELKPIWDETDQLYYATFFEEDAQVKIWIENAETISAKLDIVNNLNLKGAASWRRGFETEDIWPIFEKILK